MITAEKGVLLSKTIWGGIVTAIPLILKGLEGAELIPAGTTTDTLMLATSTAGSILSIWGRIKAKTQIKGLL